MLLFAKERERVSRGRNVSLVAYNIALFRRERSFRRNFITISPSLSLSLSLSCSLSFLFLLSSFLRRRVHACGGCSFDFSSVRFFPPLPRPFHPHIREKCWALAERLNISGERFQRREREREGRKGNFRRKRERFWNGCRGLCAETLFPLRSSGLAFRAGEPDNATIAFCSVSRLCSTFLTLCGWLVHLLIAGKTEREGERERTQEKYR